MVVHAVEFFPTPPRRHLGSYQKSFGRAFTVQFVQSYGELVLFAASKAVAPLALKLDVLLIPSCFHACAAHEMACVDFGIVAHRSTGKALTHPPVVARSEANELAEHRVHFLHHR